MFGKINDVFTLAHTTDSMRVKTAALWMCEFHDFQPTVAEAGDAAAVDVKALLCFFLNAKISRGEAEVAVYESSPNVAWVKVKYDESTNLAYEVRFEGEARFFQMDAKAGNGNDVFNAKSIPIDAPH